MPGMGQGSTIVRTIVQIQEGALFGLCQIISNLRYRSPDNDLIQLPFRLVFGLYPCGRFTTPVAVTEEVFLPLRSCNKACIPGSLTRGGHSGSPHSGWRKQCAAVSHLAGTPGRLARGGHSACPSARLAGSTCIALDPAGATSEGLPAAGSCSKV